MYLGSLIITTLFNIHLPSSSVLCDIWPQQQLQQERLFEMSWCRNVAALFISIHFQTKDWRLGSLVVNNHDRKIKTQNLEKRFGCHFTKKRELMWPGSQWCHCNINLIKLWGNKVDFLMIKSRPCSVWKVGLNEQIFSFIFGLFQATISRALVLWFEFTTPLITSLYP